MTYWGNIPILNLSSPAIKATPKNGTECEYCGVVGDGLKCKTCGAPLPSASRFPPGLLVVDGMTHEGFKSAMFIYERSHDAEDRVWAIAKEPVEAHGDTVLNLRHELLDQFLATFEPVLDAEDVPQEGAVNPADGVDWDAVETMTDEEFREMAEDGTG